MPPPFLPDLAIEDAAQTLIPGAFERKGVRQRQPGAMGGSPFGSDGMPAEPSTMSLATIAEREKEGGGGLSQRDSRRRNTR